MIIGTNFDPADDDREPEDFLRDSLRKFADCPHTHWKCHQCGCSTTLTTLQMPSMAKKLSIALDEIRDAILHERFQLAEAGLDCDQVNAVLGIIDDRDPRNTDDTSSS